MDHDDDSFFESINVLRMPGAERPRPPPLPQQPPKPGMAEAAATAAAGNHKGASSSSSSSSSSGSSSGSKVKGKEKEKESKGGAKALSSKPTKSPAVPATTATAAAAAVEAAAAEKKENPYVSVLGRKCRALRKKLERCKTLEEQQAAGKASVFVSLCVVLGGKWRWMDGWMDGSDDIMNSPVIIQFNPWRSSLRFISS
jgi:hypothetical protein